MALSYRTILSTPTPDLADLTRAWIENALGEHSEISEGSDGLLGFVAKPHRKTEVRLALVPTPTDCIVIVEERHPTSLGRVVTEEVPAYIPHLLEIADFRLGGLPVGHPVSADEIVAWIDGNEDGQLVAVIGLGHDSAVQSVLGEVRRQVLGMAVLGLLPVAAAERFLWDYYPRGRANPGAILHASRRAGETEVHLTPATAVRRQPKAAARRQRLRWCLPWQAGVRLEDEFEARLGKLWDRRVPVAATEEEWLAELDAHQREIGRLERQVLMLLEARGQAWEEQDEALRELQQVRAQLRYTQRRLREFEVTPMLESPEESDEVSPDTCAEAVEFGREILENVLFVCDTKYAEELDEHEKSSVWAGKVWGALRAMESFADCRMNSEYKGSFLMFCDDPPPTGAVGYMANSVAMGESESTDSNPTTRQARTFRVPEMIAPGGGVYMPAHVKIDKGGHPAPRIHFLDDTASSGKVVVGYVGKHLPTGGA